MRLSKLILIYTIPFVVIVIAYVLVKKFHNNLNEISIFISIIALSIVVLIYLLNTNEQHIQRKIAGREKTVKTLVNHYIARWNNIYSSGDAVDPNVLIGYPDNADIWYFLDELYSNEKETLHRYGFNYFLYKTITIDYTYAQIAKYNKYKEPLHLFWEYDKQIRKYYHMNAPKHLREDFRHITEMERLASKIEKFKTQYP